MFITKWKTLDRNYTLIFPNNHAVNRWSRSESLIGSPLGSFNNYINYRDLPYYLQKKSLFQSIFGVEDIGQISLDSNSVSVSIGLLTIYDMCKDNQ